MFAVAQCPPPGGQPALPVGGFIVSLISPFLHRFSTTKTFARLHAHIYALQSCKRKCGVFHSLT